jgi:hypothetical protein
MSRVSLSPLGLTTFVTSPQDLSVLLIQDVEVGPNERCSCIEVAIHSTQMIIQRARIGLELGWTNMLSELWECCSSTFGIWSAFKRRQIYCENWLYWGKMQKLKKFGSIVFFTRQLEFGDLSILAYGHSLWWPGSISVPPSNLTQSQELVTLKLQHDSVPEGLSLMGAPMRDGRLTLLTPTPEDWAGGTTNSSGAIDSGSISDPPQKPLTMIGFSSLILEMRDTSCSSPVV